MNIEIAAGTQHGPGGAAHLVVLTALVVIALVVVGVNRWRGTRASAAAEQRSTRHDPPAERTESREER